MHYLQKDILDKLRYHQPLTYTKLMPTDIESSLFRYHLRLLIKDGLVAKQEDKTYALTHEGQTVVDYLSENRLNAPRTPKVITYTLVEHDGKFLIRKKHKEPYRGLYELLGGKIHFGEDPAHAAQREVYEKAGLKIELPTLLGVMDIISLQDGKPLTHITAFVHRAQLAALDQASLPPEVIAVNAAILKTMPQSTNLQPLLRAIHRGAYPFLECVQLPSAP